MTHTGRNPRHHHRRHGRAGRHVLIVAVAGAVAAMRLVRRVQVDGDSMRPTLLPGDRLLILRTRTPRPADLAAVVDPRDANRLMVKRITAVRPDGTFEVAGDNTTASTDSRHFGPLTRRHLVGRVVYRYAPDERRGRV